MEINNITEAMENMGKLQVQAHNSITRDITGTAITIAGVLRATTLILLYILRIFKLTTIMLTQMPMLNKLIMVMDKETKEETWLTTLIMVEVRVTKTIIAREVIKMTIIFI